MLQSKFEAIENTGFMIGSAVKHPHNLVPGAFIRVGMPLRKVGTNCGNRQTISLRALLIIRNSDSMDASRWSHPQPGLDSPRMGVPMGKSMVRLKR
jgi:hypothetical protein